MMKSVRRQPLVTVVLLVTVVASVVCGMMLLWPTKSLDRAATDGDCWQVVYHLVRCSDINAPGSYGNPPLITAMTHNRLEVFKLLLWRGARIPAGTLDYAANAGQMEVARLLIAHGVNVNGEAGHRWTALHQAARSGRNAMVELLIAHGADVDGPGDDGIAWERVGGTALYAAAAAGWTDTVDILLAHGADINATWPNGYTLLDMAVVSGSPFLVDLLIAKGADLNPTMPGVWTPLQAAALSEWCQPERVEMIIAKGAKLDIFSASGLGRLEQVKQFLKANPSLANARTVDSLAPMDFARRRDRKDIARLLVASGSKVDLETAVWLGMVDTARSLLDADASLIDSRQCCEAMEAAASGQRTMVELMLASGFDVLERSEPLVAAAKGGHREIVEIFLAMGADVNVRNPRTPLHVAAENGDVEMARLLLAYGAHTDIIAWIHEDDEPVPLESAAGAGKKDVVKVLLEAGAGDEVTGGYITLLQEWQGKDTLPWMLDLFLAKWKADHGPRKELDEALGVAMQAELPDYMRALIGLGANVNAEHYGARAWGKLLHSASLPMAKVLLTHGADPNAVDWQGRTPLHYAERPMAELLLAHGADLNARHSEGVDSDGVTPLQMAAQRRDLDTVNFFIAKGAAVDFHSACALGRIDRVKADLATDPGLALRRTGGDRGEPPLTFAVRGGQAAVVHLLLAHGAKPGRDDLGGAIALNRKDIVLALLDGGADLGAISSHYPTALQYAMDAEHKEVVQAIQDYRAKHPGRW